MANEVEIRITGKNEAKAPLAEAKADVMSFGDIAKGVFAGNLMTEAFNAFLGGIKAVGQAFVDVFKGMGDAVVGWVADAAKAQIVSTQTDAVLKSTAGAAGMTKDALVNLAKAFANQTTFEDEAILSAENVLLKYTSIGKDVFPAATKAVLDMATATANGVIPSQESLVNVAQLVGKAMDGDTSILTGLQRAGVVFTDSEKEMIATLFGANAGLVDQQKAASDAAAALPDLHTQLNIAKMRLDEMEKSGSTSNASLAAQNFTIKKLVDEIGGAEGAIKDYNDAQLAAGDETDKAGKVMQGQQIILDRLDQKFGGTAEMVGTTALGAVERLRVGWGELGEDAGGILLPAINDFLNTTVDAFTSPELTNAWTGFVDGIKSTVDPIFGRLTRQFLGTATTIKNALVRGDWGGAISAMLSFLVGPGGAIPSIAGLIYDFVNAITSELQAHWPEIERTLAPWSKKFWDWVKQAKIDGIGYITDLFDWLGQKLSEYVNGAVFQARLKQITNQILAALSAAIPLTGAASAGFAGQAAVWGAAATAAANQPSSSGGGGGTTYDPVGAAQEQYRLWMNRYNNLRFTDSGGAITAWNEAEYWKHKLSQMNAASSYQYGGIVPGPIGMPQTATVHGGERITPVMHNWNIQANYRNYQSESSLRDDIRLFQQLGATV